MSSDLPKALASVFAEMEREHAPYVFFRDPTSGERAVLLVEGAADATQIAAVLRSEGAEVSPQHSDEYVLEHPDALTGAPRTFIIEVRQGPDRSNIASLLWRAAAVEGASVARTLIDPDE